MVPTLLLCRPAVSQQPLYLDQQQSYVPPVPPAGVKSRRAPTRAARQARMPRFALCHHRHGADPAGNLAADGFSFYLAVALGLINWPLFNNGGATPTPALTSTIVPDLHGLNYTQANARATGAGFTLALSSGSSRQGIVAESEPGSRREVSPGADPIVITLITTTTVPALKPGATLEEVELQLQQAFLRYKTQSDGFDPTLHAANIGAHGSIPAPAHRSRSIPR